VHPGHEFATYDHRKFRPEGWVETAADKLELIRPIAESHGLSMLQLACAWDLAQPAVRCVAPTLIQEAGPHARPVEEKRAELAALDPSVALSRDELDAIRAAGENSGSMALKGASLEHEGAALPDRWSLDEELDEVARRWSIDTARDLRKHEESTAKR
jgi:hypothetical protein